jgi:MoxR-like ATPase
MSNTAQTTIAIARLPIGKVAGAYNKYHPNPVAGITKTDASRWLAEKVSLGMMTIDDIVNCESGTFTSVAQTIDPALTQKVDATASVASQAQDDAMKAIQGVNVLIGDQKVLRDDLNQITRRLSVISNKIDDIRIDESAVRLSVDALIGDHFRKFSKLVEDHSAQQIVADMSSVHPTHTASCLDVFGIDVRDARGNPVGVHVWNHPDAPAVDPDFIWTEGILRHLVLSDKTGENLWFGGEKGTGKSETARQFAARTGRAFKRINFHKHTTVEEYIGAIGIEDGKTVFQPKDFLTAYASPSTVILLDEITNADPGELATLNGFLEPNACVSFGGVTHSRAPGVLVFVADNTFGSGDDSGRHAGTRLQNSALVDRFARVIPFTFLPAAFEIEAISRRTGCNPLIAEHVHAAIDVARQKVKSADIVDAPSIRSIIAFVRALSVLPARDAWETSVVARQPSESHATLHGVYEACINEQFLSENL